MRFALSSNGGLCRLFKPEYEPCFALVTLKIESRSSTREIPGYIKSEVSVAFIVNWIHFGNFHLIYGCFLDLWCSLLFNWFCPHDLLLHSTRPLPVCTRMYWIKQLNRVNIYTQTEKKYWNEKGFFSLNRFLWVENLCQLPIIFLMLAVI